MLVLWFENNLPTKLLVFHQLISSVRQGAHTQSSLRACGLFSVENSVRVQMSGRMHQELHMLLMIIVTLGVGLALHLEYD
jgi:hypothetical protein